MTNLFNELNTVVQRLLDENAILNLTARFDDAVIHQVIQTFRDLWLANSVLEIGEPNPMRAEGINQIVAVLQKFNDINEFLFRTTSRVVIALDDDRATAVAPTTEHA